MGLSVQPEWCTELPIQQQSVLFLGARGPDGINKEHPCKAVQRAYRACVFRAARYGRMLKWGEDSVGDDFMDLSEFADDTAWHNVVHRFFRTIDSLPHHFVMHLMHGAQILGYKHPDPRFQDRWFDFYSRCVKDMHLFMEPEEVMDARLSDWHRQEWESISA